jgi:hypothetical protein
LAKYLGEGTSRKKAEEKSSAFLFFSNLPDLSYHLPQILRFSLVPGSEVD